MKIQENSFLPSCVGKKSSFWLQKQQLCVSFKNKEKNQRSIKQIFIELFMTMNVRQNNSLRRSEPSKLCSFILFCGTLC